MPRSALAGLLAFAVAAPAFTAGADGQNLATLVDRLGSSSFEERERATRALLARPEAEGVLRKALRSDDEEIKKRAAWILEQYGQARSQRALGQLRHYVQNGAADSVIELVGTWELGREEDGCWAQVHELARLLVERNRQQGGTTELSFLAGMKDRPKVVAELDLVLPPKLADGEISFIRTNYLALKQRLGFGVVVSVGSVRADELLAIAVFACGPLEVKTVSGCLIVCDSDVTVTRGAVKSLIVARGKVKCGGTWVESRVVSCADVIVKDNAKKCKKCLFEPREVAPLGLVHFFDPVQIGIEVKGVAGQVRVVRCTAGKSFDIAGIRPEDAVIAIGDDAVTTPEDFRSLLRRAWAREGSVTLTVDREMKRSKVRVVAPQ
jgi:hypothetical protein